jgi:hypothetical protein
VAVDWPPLPGSIVRRVPALARLCHDLGDRLQAASDEGLRVLPGGDRTPRHATKLYPQSGDEDQRPVPGIVPSYRQAAKTARARAVAPANALPENADRRAELLARAARFDGRADAIERGEPIPDALCTPSERLENAIRRLTSQALALLGELQALEAAAPADDAPAMATLEAYAPTEPAPPPEPTPEPPPCDPRAA